ncbi:MAG: zinc ribbon domain-containing protein [Lachnospiraceae bacterium]|nr:zinc ribbon domain-containing protein [Lachnospiraceae bacterium]
MAFGRRKNKGGGAAFNAAMGAMGAFTGSRRGSHTPQPRVSHFASNMSSAPRHLRTQYNPTVNTASNIVSNVGRSILNSNRSYSSRSSFGDAMGNALGTAIGSAIVMGVSSKIQEKQQEYQDKKAAEALAAQEAARAAEQAKKEAAFHAMNKNMPNYDEETMAHLMNGAGLTEEEKAKYPLKCPHCMGVPDGTRYCPYCGGKLV